MQASPPGVEFLRTISKFRKRKKVSSLLVYVLHKTRNLAFSRRSRAKPGIKNVQTSVMHVQSCGFAHKVYCFLTFSLPSASLDLKVPITGRWRLTPEKRVGYRVERWCLYHIWEIMVAFCITMRQTCSTTRTRRQKRCILKSHRSIYV